MSIQSLPFEHMQFDPTLYPSKLPALLDITAEGFGVTPTPIEQRYWRSVSLVARVVDNYVDSELPAAIDTEVDKLLSGEPVVGLNAVQAAHFARLFEASSSNVRNSTEAALRLLPAFASRGSLAADMRQYIDVRLEEAALFARLLHVDEQHDQRRSAYNTWASAMSRAGYLADSFLDLNRDARNGRINFSPTVRERVWLATLAGTANAQAIAMTPSKAHVTAARAAINSLKKKT